MPELCGEHMGRIARCARPRPCPVHAARTTAELVTWARGVVSANRQAHVVDSTLWIAVTILKLMGDEDGLAMARPYLVVVPGIIHVRISVDEELTGREARYFATTLLHKADQIADCIHRTDTPA